jgi:hypothetical protein
MLTLPSVHRVIYKPLYVLKLDYIEKNVSKTVNVMKVFLGYYIKFCAMHFLFIAAFEALQTTSIV